MMKKIKIENQEQFAQLVDNLLKSKWETFIESFEDAINEEDYFTKLNNDFRGNLDIIAKQFPIGESDNFIWKWRFDNNSKRLDKSDFELLSMFCKERNIELNGFLYAKADYLSEIKNYTNATEYKNKNGNITSEIESDNVKTKTQNISWQKRNETEFVQLIYALFEAGYINNQDNEITKLVPDFAKILNFKLGNNWQSNLSKSINDRNADYMPQIFENITKGFSKYRDKQISKKEKK